MVSLELEARLDDLLSTAQEETKDIDLFAPIAEREECPICLLPLPIEEDEMIFEICCGKKICQGCTYKHMLTNLKKGVRDFHEFKCAFCCQSQPQNPIKALKKLMKKNEPQAFMRMAARYESGEGLIQSDTKSLEMFICAAELGYALAYGNIGLYYQEGTAVERDMSKALEFHKVAAKKGNVHAHRHMASFYGGNNNIQHCIKHLKVSASAGDQESMDDLMAAYKDKLLSKDDLAQILRAFQASLNETKSKDRDNARVFEEYRQRGEAPPFHLLR